MFGKLALLISVEMFVLIAAIFLLVYITKQQVSKWFTYGSFAIIITVLAMMVCTMCCVICGHCGQNRMERECHFENERCNKMMMMKMHEGRCEEMEGEDDDCEMKKNCEMKKECCEGKEGMMKKECCEGKDGKMVKVIIDSLPKKELNIKKK